MRTVCRAVTSAWEAATDAAIVAARLWQRWTKRRTKTTGREVVSRPVLWLRVRLSG
jgi:hypothetical protein